MAFLEIKGVWKGYPSRDGWVPVLRDVNLSMERGEFLAVVGFTGSGKTTLVSLLAGLIRPDRGTIRLGGREITSPGPDRGVVFQNYSLLPWLTVEENVALAVDQTFPCWPEEVKRKHVDRNVALVRLNAARGKRPGELSGGMRQRVAVARALALDPEMLLLDEPLSALDALTRSRLQDELEQIWEKDRKTVVLITNDVEEGVLLADRIVPLTAGPEATLGPSISIDLPRPRDRKALGRHPRFKEVRAELIEFLLRSRRQALETQSAARIVR